MYVHVNCYGYLGDSTIYSFSAYYFPTSQDRGK